MSFPSSRHLLLSKLSDRHARFKPQLHLLHWHFNHLFFYPWFKIRRWQSRYFWELLTHADSLAKHQNAILWFSQTVSKSPWMR